MVVSVTLLNLIQKLRLPQKNVLSLQLDSYRNNKRDMMSVNVILMYDNVIATLTCNSTSVFYKDNAEHCEYVPAGVT